jgi:hypothetical protein
MLNREGLEVVVVVVVEFLWGEGGGVFSFLANFGTAVENVRGAILLT